MAEISVTGLAGERASGFNSHTRSRRRGEKESNEEVEDYHHHHHHQYYCCSTPGSPIASPTLQDSPTFSEPKSRHSHEEGAISIVTTNSTKSSPSISANNNNNKKLHLCHVKKSSRSLQISCSREVEVKGSGDSRVRWRILFFQECRKRGVGVADSLVRAVKRASSFSSSSSSSSSLCRSNTFCLGEGAKVSTSSSNMSSSGRTISASSSSKSLSCEWVRHEEVKSAIAHCKQSSSSSAFFL